MKYKVSVRYIDIIFYNGEEALAFATQAKMHADEEDIRVTIEILHEKTEEDA